MTLDWGARRLNPVLICRAFDGLAGGLQAKSRRTSPGWVAAGICPWSGRLTLAWTEASVVCSAERRRLAGRKVGAWRVRAGRWLPGCRAGDGRRAHIRRAGWQPEASDLPACAQASYTSMHRGRRARLHQGGRLATCLPPGGVAPTGGRMPFWRLGCRRSGGLCPVCQRRAVAFEPRLICRAV